jgi:hypothetical protein
MTQAMTALGDILLVPIAGAYELAILHGIACPLLSRAIGPAKGVSLPSNTSDNSSPDIPIGIELIRTYFCIAMSHSPCAVDEILQALVRTGCLLHQSPPRGGLTVAH